MSQHNTLTLREALRSIQYEAASLADAQVIALQALNATYPARAALSATQPAQAAQGEPTLRDYAADLVDAGHDFWKACEREAGGGAVRWLSCDDGTLIVFTRVEYRDEIMAHVRGYKAPVVVFDEDGMTALEAEAAQGEPDTDAHTLAHNMRMWVDDARQHNREYVPVHVSTLEKMICYLSQKVASNGFVMVPKKCTAAMKDVGIQFEFATISDGRLLAQTMWNELLIAATQAPLQQAAQGEPLCDDEGCDHHGTPHVCVNNKQPAQGAGEVVAWCTPDGERCVTARTYEGARKDGGAMWSSMVPFTVPAYTQPATGAVVPDMVEIMALADSYRNATCHEATASAREWLRAAIAASGRQE